MLDHDLCIYGKRMKKSFACRKWTNIRFEGGPCAFVWLCKHGPEISFGFKCVCDGLYALAEGHLQPNKHVGFAQLHAYVEAPLPAFLIQGIDDGLPCHCHDTGAQGLDSKTDQVDRQGQVAQSSTIRPLRALFAGTNLEEFVRE